MGDDVFDDVSSFSIRPAMDLFDSTMSVRMAMMALLVCHSRGCGQ